MDDASSQAESAAEDLPFRAMAQNLPTPCWISDAQGAIVWVNDAWVAYTGMTAGQIAERGLDELHDPEILKRVRRRWRECLERGEATEMVFPLRGRDGRLRPFRTHVAPLRDRSGQVIRWFGTNTDVSDQSETEARLRTREEELRGIFEAAGDGVFLARRGRVVDVNPAGAAMLGYPREELIGRSLADLLAPEEHERLRAAQSSPSVDGEWRMRRKDGRVLDVAATIRTLPDGRRLAVTRDVSEKNALARRLARRIDEAERQRQRFWEASRDLLAIIPTRDGGPDAFNAHAWEATLGYGPEEVMRLRFGELVHPDDQPRLQGLAAALDRGEVVQGVELRCRRRDGGWAWTAWTIVREDGLNFCIGRDVTEEKARAEHAERSQRLEALGKLTGGVAHDFNNLLTTILGALDLMQRKPEDRVLRERLMTAALAAVRRGERLNRQLLSFARREPVGARATDLHRLLADMRPLLESALDERVALRYDLMAAPAVCASDPAQIEAAVLNLVMNARDAMPDGGAVTLRTRPTHELERARYGLQGEGHLVLEVCDTGEGMSPEVAAHAFEPFFTTKPVGKGSGLGLSQVYGAARQAGGLATVESEAGAGTTVRLILAAGELEAEAEPAARDVGARPERVLLVEDDTLVGVVTESLLESAGYEVRRTEDAVEALTALRQGRFDILVTDVRMPGAMNGVQLAREATRRMPSLKVLLCSGWTAESLGADFAASPWPFLPKPFDETALRRALAELRAPEPTLQPTP